MGQQQSKDELLYQQVINGNMEAIKALHREGAGLEYVDREGKTPLVAASMNPALYNVAKTLIELGANVNAYRPGRQGGTPLHHAAKRGLEETVNLLLSHGANALLMNDDCQTPLDVARAKGYCKVVHTIESHICLFSSWLRELYGPSFLEVLAPQLLSRKVWVVVLPCGSRNLKKPFKLQLAIYASIQDAQPRTTIALWRAHMEEPAYNQSDPTLIISEAVTISRRGRRRRCRPRRVSQNTIKLAPVNESDKHRLQQLCRACKGIPQVMHPTLPHNTSKPITPATAPPDATEAEDLELAMAISASLQSAIEEGIPRDHTPATSGASSSAGYVNSLPAIDQNNPPSSKVSLTEQPIKQTGPNGTTLGVAVDDNRAPMPVPSAPTEVPHDGPIRYPTIDSTSAVEKDHISNNGVKESGSSSCVICFDAPLEGACVPCGHMAGCMSCLNEIKAKKWGCPVCRANIDNVIRVYAV